MYPLAKGSVQSVKAPRDYGELKHLRWSAPQVTVAEEKPAAARLDVFTQAVSRPRKPQLYFSTLFAPDQLAFLSTLSAEQALSTIVSSLPEEETGSELASNLGTLLFSVLRWAGTNKLREETFPTLLTIYYNTYKYCLESPWRTQAELYEYFKESLLLHSVKHSPHSERVFRPQECRDCLIHFCHYYLTTLPLLRLTSLPNYRLRFLWRVTLEEQQIESKELEV